MNSSESTDVSASNSAKKPSFGFSSLGTWISTCLRCLGIASLKLFKIRSDMFLT